MTTEETYRKLLGETYRRLLGDLQRDRTEIEHEMKRLMDAYGEKMVEYRKVSHGIIGIENELKQIKGAD
jgi:predicted  nucleic acid-binding Zn-ribbon protein